MVDFLRQEHVFPSAFVAFADSHFRPFHAAGFRCRLAAAAEAAADFRQRLPLLIFRFRQLSGCR